MRYLYVLMFLLLSACASTGTKVDKSVLDTFVKGKTTYATVIQQLGPPDKAAAEYDGTTTIKYTHKRSVASAANFLPIVGGFIEAGAGSDDTIVTITFDKNSVLAGYQVSELNENKVRKITKRL